jgi:outer membrane protein assembly factor BamE
MRVNYAVLHRLSYRAPLVAALVCATLTLSGCAAWFSPASSEAPFSELSTASDAQKAAAAANAGAQTTTVTKLQKFLWVFSPYRPDIQQGNFVSQEMLAQLKVGQTRDQVKFILGTPLMMDIFHGDRWDYPFYLARGNGELTSARVTVYFKDDKVAKFDGGNLPTEKEYIARIAGPTTAPPKKPPADAPKDPLRRADPGAAGGQVQP